MSHASNPSAASASAATSKSDNSIASRIGRFCITRELGRGTVGCVYLAHDPIIGRDVAIKTFHPRMSLTEKDRHENQFINEARAAGRLSHPNIVTVYDVASEGSVPFIALEYLNGQELDKMLDGGHRFTPHQVATILRKIADAVHHAHLNSVIHRDIKPGNIFMVGEDHPKLVDFGIARSPNRFITGNTDVDNPQTLFHADHLLGTPNYMSPEQALGKQVDARTDVYSLGAVMYEMLTGRKPFHASSADKLLEQIAYKAPPAPHEVDSRVPAMLSAIVVRAMSKRPEKRYQTAEEMALDIKGFLIRERRRRRRQRMAAAQETGQSAGRAKRTVEVPTRPSSNYLALALAFVAACAVAIKLLR